jgi:hypothetical protein
MSHSSSRRDIVVALLVALLVAVWAHVGLFFVFAVLLFFNLLSGKIIEEEKDAKKEKQPIKMQMVYAETPVAPVVPVVEAAAPEPEVQTAMPDTPAFVQTDETQESDVAPEETPLIGERNTTATSDVGAVAGDEAMAALSGEENRKSDPKTFDSDFSEGETSGPKEGVKETVEAGKGAEQVNEQAAVAEVPSPMPVDELLPEMEEEMPEPKRDELASIEETLAALEEAIGDEKKDQPKKPSEKVEETPPEKPAAKEQEASNQDGGFAPKANKTRVAGVLSASGKGSLNVADTPAGRYQADILKKLETAWQMDNINNRSLNAPGQITLYFEIDQKGQVSRLKQVSRVGTSDNQFGRVLGEVQRLAIPKMPKAVIKDLDGDALDITVTFNY